MQASEWPDLTWPVEEMGKCFFVNRFLKRSPMLNIVSQSVATVAANQGQTERREVSHRNLIINFLVFCFLERRDCSWDYMVLWKGQCEILHHNDRRWWSQSRCEMKVQLGVSVGPCSQRTISNITHPQLDVKREVFTTVTSGFSGVVPTAPVPPAPPFILPPWEPRALWILNRIYLAETAAKSMSRQLLRRLNNNSCSFTNSPPCAHIRHTSFS